MNDKRWMGLVAGLLLVWVSTGCRLGSRSALGSQAGDTKTVDLGGDVKLELVWCPPGTFTMGSPANEDGREDDETRHKVTLTKGFWLGKYEVMQEEYEKLMGKNPSKFKGARNPVEEVSWNDAVAFCKKMTEQERAGGRLPDGYEYRLPTEAEWEYAARGGPKSQGFTYSGSNSVGDVAWYDENSDRKTHAVGQRKPNEFGIHDMSGNVYEWCRDWSGSYPSGTAADPTGAGTGSFRVYRGGSWFSYARFCRSANRGGSAPTISNSYLGFRVALAAPVR